VRTRGKVKVGQLYIAPNQGRIAISGYPDAETAKAAEMATPREWKMQYSELTVPLVGPYLVIDREGRARHLLGTNSCAWIIGDRFSGLLEELETGDE
jgi:hypothetical protein